MAVIKLSAILDLLALHASQPARYPYLLQTLGAAGGEGWDILFAFPVSSSQYALTNHPSHFFADLEAAWQKSPPHKAAPETANLPFRGGWFLYLGYELLHETEPTVAIPAAPASPAFPLACRTRIPAAILVDHAKKQAHLFAEPGFENCLPQMQQDLAALAEQPDSASAGVRAQSKFGVEEVLEEDSAHFTANVERAKQYIRDGDIFQANLSRSWQARLVGEGRLAPLVYAKLREKNPAPFSGLANFGDSQIISSSPERLLKVTGKKIETRPIAGTHPRSADPAEDQKLRTALRAHPKERAEHIMLVDLERNDLGRICTPGSVVVEELMAINSYAHVHHIESKVSGELRDDVTPVAILRALFPGGTITGCPKVRAMQIINELERTPRLAYTGSMGYLNRDGDMDMNILIRSFMLTGQQLSFRAGAGIVADSDPQRELEETRAKAKGLLKVLED